MHDNGLGSGILALGVQLHIMTCQPCQGLRFTPVLGQQSFPRLALSLQPRNQPWWENTFKHFHEKNANICGNIQNNKNQHYPLEKGNMPVDCTLGLCQGLLHCRITRSKEQK